MSILDELSSIEDTAEEYFPIGDVALEGISETPNSGSGETTGFLGKGIPTHALEEYSRIRSLADNRKALEGLERVDKAIALESVALSHYANDPITKGSFTNAPSAINRKLLDDVIFTEKEEIPSELHDYISEVIGALKSGYLDKAGDTIGKATEALSKLKSIASEDKAGLNLITTNATVNLLNSPIADVIGAITEHLNTPGVEPGYISFLLELRKNLFNIKLASDSADVNKSSPLPEGSECSVASVLDQVSGFIAYGDSELKTVVTFSEDAAEYVDKEDRSLENNGPTSGPSIVERLGTLEARQETINCVVNWIEENQAFFDSIVSIVTTN